MWQTNEVTATTAESVTEQVTFMGAVALGIVNKIRNFNIFCIISIKDANLI